MNRLKDYIGFAIWFAGVGYILLWPLAANGHGGKLFGDSLLCGSEGPLPLYILCHAAHPLTLPPTLHVLGTASVLAAGLRLLCAGWRRCRRAATAAGSEQPVEAPTLRVPAARLRPLRPLRPSTPAKPLRAVKPRDHFGLRGIKRTPELQDMA